QRDLPSFPTRRSSDLEDFLLSMEGIKEAGVTGREDEEWGQVPIAFVVSEKAWTEEELRAYCEQHLARFKVPRKFYFCESLPRNRSEEHTSELQSRENL